MPAAVRLEALTERHAREMYPLLADPGLWRFTDGGLPESETSLAARYARLERRTSPAGDERWLNWIVRAVASGTAQGFVQATIPIGSATAAIAYVIAPQYAGRGSGGAAVRLMLAELEHRAGVRAVTASVDARNAPSVALLERLGLRCVDASAPASLLYAGILAT